MSAPAPTSLFPPQALVAKAYKVLRSLGSGASGTVYLAERARDRQAVALKVIHRELCGDRQIFLRFQREADILRTLSGDHIVRFYDYAEHEGLVVIALEFVDGLSLDQVAQKQLDVGQATEIALQICNGLATAHAAGVVHRDLKPQNVIVLPRAFPERPLDAVKILDFGLATVVHGNKMTTGLTEHDMIFGTPEYMAPEQARGEDADQRCDLYALGVMLYEMVSGKVPFSHRSPLATMTAQLTEAVTPPRFAAPHRDIPPAVESVILRALEKDPDKRFSSALELRDALLAARERRVVTATPSAEVDLGETDLAIRVSQVMPERRERIDAASIRTPFDARASSSSNPARRSTPQIVPEPTPASGRRERRATIVMFVVAIGLALAVGAWLALR